MEKKYIKPEMTLTLVEPESVIASSLGLGDGYADQDGEVYGKRRGGYSSFSSEDEEEWVKETDMWGNECWTRTR